MERGVKQKQRITRIMAEAGEPKIAHYVCVRVSHSMCVCVCVCNAINVIFAVASLRFC